MGLLDEAIRQHLELKRQHGASDEELQMQEQEALGPVRREPEDAAAATPAETEPAPEPDAEHPHAEEPAEVPTAAPAYEDDLEELDSHDDDLAVPDPPTEPEFAFEPELAPEPELEPESGETPPRGFEAVQEPDAEDALLEEEDEDEDVLEETPEFLQETPEHDRLWFEQKPPRDFDFDE